MIVFGLHSSFFDIVTFVVLYKLMNAPVHMFQTGWFLESTISELCILFIIRTQKNFFQSRPKKTLIWLSIMAVLVTIGMIYVPFADRFDMYRLPLQIVGIIAVILFFYIITADILKKAFFKKLGKMA